MQLILVVGKVEYDQSDLPDVIILLKVVVSLFCIKMITKYITKGVFH